MLKKAVTYGVIILLLALPLIGPGGVELPSNTQPGELGNFVGKYLSYYLKLAKQVAKNINEGFNHTGSIVAW